MTFSIRHVEPDDFEAVRNVYQSEHAFANTLQLPFASIDTWRKRLADTQHVRGLVACHERDIIGHVALHTFPNPRRSHAAMIGMAVRDDWQGKGVGSALLQSAINLAENWLQLTRLELTVFADNEAAQALYRKFGFTLEGTHRRYAFRDGRFVDVLAMARLRA